MNHFNQQIESLIQEMLHYAYQQPPLASFTVSAEEARFFQTPPIIKKAALTNLKNQGFLKKTPQNLNLKPSLQTDPAFNLPSLQSKAQLSVHKASDPIKPSQEPPHKINPQAAACPDQITQILKKIAPSISIIDQIPDDHQAQHIASGWKEWIPHIDMILLLLDSSPQLLVFMKNLAKAIQKDLGTVKIITGERLEKEKKWDLFLTKNTFKLIITSSHIQCYPNLLQYYKGIPSQTKTFLNNTPLLILHPIEEYDQLPSLKLELWKQLCEQIQ